MNVFRHLKQLPGDLQGRIFHYDAFFPLMVSFPFVHTYAHTSAILTCIHNCVCTRRKAICSRNLFKILERALPASQLEYCVLSGLVLLKKKKQAFQSTSSVWLHEYYVAWAASWQGRLKMRKARKEQHAESSIQTLLTENIILLMV